MPNTKLELGCIHHLASLTGWTITDIRDPKSVFGPTECGIDVVFDFNLRRCGAQQTTFHYDANKNGSPARALNAKNAKAASEGAHFGTFDPDWKRGLRHCILDKIKKAGHYDNPGLAETWLVISSALPNSGAIIATMMFVTYSGFADELKDFCHDELAQSCFDRAFLIVHQQKIVYAWERVNRWHPVACADDQENERPVRRVLRYRWQSFLNKEIPLCEAARLTFEQVKDTRGGKIAFAARPTQDGIIEYYTYALAEKIPVYGIKPPSQKKEKINIPLGSGMAHIECKGGTASLSSGFANRPDLDATKLFVMKTDLKRAIEQIEQTV